MAENNYVLKSPETVSMSGEDARKLIGCGSGDAALVYLYILNAGGRFDRMDAAKKTGRTPEQMDAAMAVLSSLGLVTSSAPKPQKKLEPADELPQYTTEDVLAEEQSDPDFTPLVQAAQQVLGRMLGTEDVKTLLGIHSYLGLPYEVILQLVVFCRDECQRRGRITTLRYIEKVAFTWEREGIFSLDAAESYIRSLGEKRSARSAAARAMGIWDRQLSATESKYVDAWLTLGFGADAIAVAYDRTVTNTGKLSWRYMDSIIKSWHQKNLHSVEEINAGDSSFVPSERKPRSKPAKAQQTPGATQEDLERMRATLRKIRGEE